MLAQIGSSVNHVSTWGRSGCGRQCSVHYVRAMGAIRFTCRTTPFKVQHLLDDNEDAPEDDYEGINCQACAGVRYVNRRGEVLDRRRGMNGFDLDQRCRTGKAHPCA